MVPSCVGSITIRLGRKPGKAVAFICIVVGCTPDLPSHWIALTLQALESRNNVSQDLNVIEGYGTGLSASRLRTRAFDWPSCLSVTVLSDSEDTTTVDRAKRFAAGRMSHSDT